MMCEEDAFLVTEEKPEKLLLIRPSLSHTFSYYCSHGHP